MKKNMYLSKIYVILFICGLIVFFIFLFVTDKDASFFWKTYYFLFIIVILVMILICFNSRISLYEDYFLERFIITKKIEMNDIDYVVYKKKVFDQDYIFNFKNGKKYKMLMPLKRDDDVDFKKYLLSNKVRIIEKH